VTEEKTADRTQYHDKLRVISLEWDGQMSVRSDKSIINHEENGVDLLLFYRKKKTTCKDYGFRYEGRFRYITHWGEFPTHFILSRVTSFDQQIEEDIEDFLDEYEFIEETRVERMTSRYERDKQVRKEAIEYHGTKCMACGFDFGEAFGPHGEGYIEVHHCVPFSDQDGEISVNPKIDTIVLCSNCHRMVDRRKSYTLSLDELQLPLEWAAQT